MQDIELRFPSLKVLIAFKQLSQVKDLRIDTLVNSLTGKFPDDEVVAAIRQFKARTQTQQVIERTGRQPATVSSLL